MSTAIAKNLMAEMRPAVLGVGHLYFGTERQRRAAQRRTADREFHSV